MKRYLFGLLALTLLAVPAQANGKVGAGFGAGFNHAKVGHFAVHQRAVVQQRFAVIRQPVFVQRQAFVQQPYAFQQQAFGVAPYQTQAFAVDPCVGQQSFALGAGYGMGGYGGVNTFGVGYGGFNRFGLNRGFSLGRGFGLGGGFRPGFGFGFRF